MPVLGPVRQDEKHWHRGRALGKAIQERARFAIDPMQIFEDHQDRLNLRLTQEEAPDRIERALTTLRGAEVLPPRIVDRYVEQGEECRKRGLQCAVQRQ